MPGYELKFDRVGRLFGSNGTSHPTDQSEAENAEVPGRGKTWHRNGMTMSSGLISMSATMHRSIVTEIKPMKMAEILSVSRIFFVLTAINDCWWRVGGAQGATMGPRMAGFRPVQACCRLQGVQILLGMDLGQLDLLRHLLWLSYYSTGPQGADCSKLSRCNKSRQFFLSALGPAT
jgi:hypothetical protein